jgi:hypothetical protein
MSDASDPKGRAQDSSLTLLQRCISAQRDGADFPAIWSLILKNHPLVAGLPNNSVKAGRIRLEVPLITGQRLVCDAASGEFTLD